MRWVPKGELTQKPPGKQRQGLSPTEENLVTFDHGSRFLGLAWAQRKVQPQSKQQGDRRQQGSLMVEWPKRNGLATSPSLYLELLDGFYNKRVLGFELTQTHSFFPVNNPEERGGKTKNRLAFVLSLCMWADLGPFSASLITRLTQQHF